MSKLRWYKVQQAVRQTRSLSIKTTVVRYFLLHGCGLLVKIPFDSMSLHKELIEDTSYKLKPVALLCAALGVVNKFGQRPLHLA